MQRIIDVFIPLVRLRIENKTLHIENKQTNLHAQVPLPDILVVLVSSPAVSLTHAVLAELAEAGIPYIATNRKYMPVGILLPFSNNALQGERFWKQREFSAQDILWKQIILSKIKNSASVLSLWNRSNEDLHCLIKQVELNNIDPSVAEAQAAKINFNSLFETGFTRRDSDHPENARLNYGYVVLRACVARFICASGLHPTFGVHHKNKYNAFALADDFMEPFRPFIDHVVMELVRAHKRVTVYKRLYFGEIV